MGFRNDKRAFGKRTGFIEHGGAHVRKRFHSCTAFKQNPLPSRRADSAEKRQRDGNNECARTRNDKKDYCAGNPRFYVARYD